MLTSDGERGLSGGPCWEGLEYERGAGRQGSRMAQGSCRNRSERPIRRQLLWTKQKEVRLELERRQFAWK